eukprot:3348566-Pleurochrysis_carterae.AAC.1
MDFAPRSASLTHSSLRRAASTARQATVANHCMGNLPMDQACDTLRTRDLLRQHHMQVDTTKSHASMAKATDPSRAASSHDPLGAAKTQQYPLPTRVAAAAADTRVRMPRAMGLTGRASACARVRGVVESDVGDESRRHCGWPLLACSI